MGTRNMEVAHVSSTPRQKNRPAARRRTEDLDGHERVARETYKLTRRLVGHKTSTATQSKFLQITCTAQIFLTICFFIVAGLADDPDSRNRNIITGIVGFFNSMLGFYGTWKKDRGYCMLFFIIELWT